MYNDRLSSEEAKKYVEERMKEADSYGLQQRLGYGGLGIAKWIFVLLIIMGIILALGALF